MSKPKALLTIASCLLLLSGCDELREFVVADNSEHSHYLCSESTSHFDFVLTFDRKRQLYINGDPWEAVIENMQLTVDSLTIGDLYHGYETDPPRDPTRDAKLNVDLITGRFRAWIHTDMSLDGSQKVGRRIFGKCTEIDATFKNF